MGLRVSWTIAGLTIATELEYKFDKSPTIDYLAYSGRKKI
jgi:hypothetical protein